MMGSKWISIWLICPNTKCDIFFVHRMSLDPFWWDQLDQNSEGNKKLKFSNLGSVYRMILCGVQAKEKTPYSQMQLNNRNVLLFTIYQLTITPPKKNINYNFGFKLKLRWACADTTSPAKQSCVSSINRFPALELVQRTQEPSPTKFTVRLPFQLSWIGEPPARRTAVQGGSDSERCLSCNGILRGPAAGHR